MIPLIVSDDFEYMFLLSEILVRFEICIVLLLCMHKTCLIKCLKGFLWFFFHQLIVSQGNYSSDSVALFEQISVRANLCKI